MVFSKQSIIISLKIKIILFKTSRQVIPANELNLLQEFPVFINKNNYDENVASKIVKLERIDENNENDNNRWAKHLDVRIDPKLKFNHQWGELHRRLQGAIFSLHIMKDILDMQLLKLLYFSYVHS